jgi:hypothetical protein
MKTIFCFIISCAWLGALGATTQIEEATVTLPYTELSSLLDRVNAVERSLHVLLEPHAEVAVTLGLPLTGASRSSGGQVIAEFFAIGAVQSSLMISHGMNPEALAVIGAVGANRAKTEFSLPALGGRVAVKLYEDTALEPTRWRSEAQYLVRDTGGAVEVLCHLRLKATDGGRTSQATLRLPSDSERSSAITYYAYT